MLGNIFRVGLHNIPKSGLTEAAQASMNAASEKNISLVNATYAVITDSARLDAKWINRIEGESRIRSISSWVRRTLRD